MKRDSLIFEMRKQGLTLREIGDAVNLSCERIRQILKEGRLAWPKKLTPTPRQIEVLTFIWSYHREHGWPPTIKEIVDNFGFCSTRGAVDHVHALDRKGFLKPRKKFERAAIMLDTRKIGVKVTPAGIEFWRRVHA